MCGVLFILSCLLNNLYAQAPGEAEAELGWLNYTNAIDVAMTSDSDTFIFGALYVL